MERQQFNECIDQPMDVVSDEPTVRMSVQTAIDRVLDREEVVLDQLREENSGLRRENLALRSTMDKLLKSLSLARLAISRDGQARRDLEVRVNIAETMVGELLLKLEMTARTGTAAR